MTVLHKDACVLFVLAALFQSGCTSEFKTSNITNSGVVGPAPAVDDLSITSGSINGGVSVDITGNNFLSVPRVTFGGAVAPVNFLSPTNITVITPSHSANTVNVVVTNPDGQSVERLNAFTYIDTSGRVTSESLAPPPQVPGYNLAFADDFDAIDLSADGKGAHTWYRGIWQQQTLPAMNQISANGSILSLTWKVGQKAGDTSISTLSPDAKHFTAWRYGYFEARMRWDVVTGAWPAFWLIPVQNATGRDINNDGTKEFGEIDIFEGEGSEPHVFRGTIHDWINGADHRSEPHSFALPSTVDLSRYHTYGMLWTPGRFTWYLDNVTVGSSTNAPAIFDKQDFFMVLGAQEGVDWKYNNLSGVTASTMQLDVDWVRVWQQ